MDYDGLDFNDYWSIQQSVSIQFFSWFWDYLSKDKIQVKFYLNSIPISELLTFA